MFMFYNRQAPTAGAFETAMAIRIGDRVAAEMAVAGRDELKLAARASDSVVANGFR